MALPYHWWPLFASSFVFAMMHFGQGAAPIPLFCLSLGLGYMYRQTASLVAPFVVHAVLNFTTLVVAYTQAGV
jgi:membrane protease YdiL (CAAX protease family)